MNTQALKDLLFRLADDKLILGHRHSEWIGLGPILEEDIAFASMAQDEVGHAMCYYQLLEALGEADPDTTAFTRSAAQFRCCQFVEYPIGDYAFSLVRHFLFDMADKVRLKHLSVSKYRPLAELATKIAREEKYHQMHALTFLRQLGNSTADARQRLQTALDEAFPMAYGLFEPTVYSDILDLEEVQPHEDTLMKEWQVLIYPLIEGAGLRLPDNSRFADHFGGRSGYHTPHLQPMLTEMQEVFAIDPEARW